MFFGRENKITANQLRDFFRDEIIADVSIVEKHGHTFQQFFNKYSFLNFIYIFRFFDQKKKGFVTLSGILSAFHDNIELKISIDHVFKIFLNYSIHLENFLNFELIRVYKNNDSTKSGFILFKTSQQNEEPSSDSPVNPYLQWLNLKLLEDVLHEICPNKANVEKAMKYAMDAYAYTMVDYYGMKYIVRKYKLFEYRINELYSK